MLMSLMPNFSLTTTTSPSAMSFLFTKISTGWLVFQLTGRRPGQVRSLADVEMQIRQVLFQRKFNDLLDAHLNLLKERSDIVLFADRIEAYFDTGS